jgi:hypothetical protein
VLVATHDDTEGLSAQHDAMLERIELCGCGNQSWILAFDADLLLHADVLALVLERAVSLIMCRGTRAAKGDREAITDAKARERLLFCLLRLECADFQDEGSVENEQVEGDCGRQCGIKSLVDVSAFSAPV